MSFIAAAVIAGGATLGAAYLGSRGASSAAQTQADAANRAADLQYQMWQEQQKLQEPWRQAGETALNKLIPMATNYTPFGMQQFQQDPGYQFRLLEGLKALDRQAAARGGLISGGALKAAERYGQEMGSQEYMNAFNRYQTERQAQLNPLQSLAGLGQTSTNQLMGAAGQYGTNVGELGMQVANARASGYMGQANALSGALTSGANQYMNYQMMNRLFPQQAAATPAWGGYPSVIGGTADIPMQPGGGY